MESYNQQYIVTADGAVPVVEKDYNISQAAQLWMTGEDGDSATPDRPTKPLAQNEWVYICVMAIIEAARSIQLMLSTTDDKVVESGPVHDFLYHNPDLPFTQFITQTVGFLALDRTAYWVFDGLDVRTPQSIMVVGQNQLKPVIRRGILIGWYLKAPGGDRVPFLIDEVYPLLGFNPYSDVIGLGPTTVGKLAISASYQAALLNESTLANGGKIGNIITTPNRLEPSEVRLLRSQFEARHKGARNAGRTAVLSGGADIKTIAQTMADLQMLDLRAFDAKTICSLFGVPPEIVGLSTEAQYSHGPAQQRFVANTIDPMLTFIGGHIDTGIISRFSGRQRSVSLKDCRTWCGRTKNLRTLSSYRKGKQKAIAANSHLFAWFAVEEHPTMQDMLRERAEKTLKYTESGVPLNQIIDAYDLPFEQVPWGDDWWIPMGQVPASFTLEAGLEGLTGPALPEGETPGEDEEEGKGIDDLDTKTKADEQEDDRQRLRVWRNWVISWAGLEREYNESLRKFFLRQQRILIQKLKQAYQELKSYDSKITTKDTDAIIANVVFDLKIENGKIRVINETFFGRAMELGIRQALTEASGLQDDAFESAVDMVKRSQRLKKKRIISTTKITKVNQTTQAMVGRHLRAGLERGDSLNDLTKQIAKDLGSNRARALTIARTQTAGALDSGRHEGFRQSGVDGKSWITSGDDQVRDAHRAAGAMYGKAIPLDQSFVVDGERLMYPGDPAGSAANIVNCRCLEIAMALREERSVTDYINIKFYSYSDMRAAQKKAG
jgi:HK97 family phage portal protein